MSFESIEQIIKDFDLDTVDPEEIRKQLRSMLAEIHPDKNGGDFSSPTEQERYFKINSAIEYIDSLKDKQTAMVPVSAITDIAKIIRDLMPPKQTESSEVILSSKIDSKLAHISSRYSFRHSTPKITTAAISTLITALMAFPNLAEQNPYLQFMIVKYPALSQLLPNIWLGSLLLAGVVWYRYSYIETQERSFNSNLKLESIQNALLDDFLSESGGDFTKDDFVDFLMRPRFHYMGSRLFSILFRTLWKIAPWLYEFFFRRPDIIEPEIAQQLADIIFLRAESRGSSKRITRSLCQSIIT